MSDLEDGFERLVTRVVDARIDARIGELDQRMSAVETWHRVLRVSVDEAARRLGIGRTILYERIDARKLHVIHDGGRTLVHVDEIARYACEEGDRT